MLVTGNLSARDLSIVDDAALLVEGELELEGVVAIGGGNLGHLNVRGKVRCRAALQFAYGQLHFRGGCSGLVLADPGSRVKGQLEMAVLGRDILLPTLIDDDNESEPDRERIQQAIVQGKPVLR